MLDEHLVLTDKCQSFGAIVSTGKIPVGYLERYVKDELPTKQSDTQAMPLSGGRKIESYEFMFLMPKRALSENRGGGLCDINTYYCVGRVEEQDIMIPLGDGKQTAGAGIFARYGEREEDRKLTLNTHSLRHLLTTELFRQGLSDIIITQHFNRRSIAENYTYDHRSLGEQLAAQSLPAAGRELPEKPRAVASLIKAGLAGGPVVDKFKEIQKTAGDDAAYSFLAGEADGFHPTPYGYCINSFVIDPCQKHLQCFDGCEYLVACLLDRQRTNLERLHEKMRLSLEEMKKRRGGIGLKNQILHAERLIANIEKLLAANDGESPFRDGRDLHVSLGHNGGPPLDHGVGSHARLI